MIPATRKAAAIEAFAIQATTNLRDSGAPVPPWSELPAMFKHAQLEATAKIFNVIWPILEDEEAIILRARIEMLVDDLIRRGEAILAAEVKRILTDPIGD